MISLKKYSSYLLLVGLFAVVLSLVIYQQTRHRRPTSVPQDNATNQTTPLQEVIQPNAFFYTKIFLNRNKTFISVPYKFKQQELTLWLSLSTQTGYPQINRLIYHPTLAQLDWDYLRSPGDDGLTLYQKSKRYSNLNDFLANPPKGATILGDDYLLNHPSYQHLQLQPLPDDPKAIDLASVDYILTTFNPQIRHENELQFYETILDATNALVDDKDQLSWLIYAPYATDSASFYIGNIHVDYR